MFDLISGWIEAGGALGVFGLMLLENVFPPIPSELVMPLAGFKAAQGQMSLWLVVLAGTAGATAGAYLWYWIGAAIGADRLRRIVQRHGLWLTISEQDINRALGWFDRHGEAAIFFGRMIPGVRTFISVPAGLAGMRRGRFLALTALGSLFWTALLTAAGYVLEAQYDLVKDWLNPVTTAVVGLLVAAYIWRLGRALWRRSRAS
ncbi:DedA family protein [Aestuariibius insulae]|uniref:DedA family protein n=1 Tax=Aestuariibius insulae TaxID=2058287 RepID=UPI00345ED44D